MKTKSKYFIMFPVVLGIGIFYGMLNYCADREIKRITEYDNYRSIPPTWVSYVPGKANKFIDSILKNMKIMYERKPENRKYEFFDHLTLFCNKHASGKTKKVYSAMVNFFTEKRNYDDAMFYAREYSIISKDDSLLKKIEKDKSEF